jgi:uncharacterized protein (TIGR03435 family)
MTPVRFAATALLLCGVGAAQNAFEVASVKPSDPKVPYVQWLTYPGGRIVITNHTLTMLIEGAYDGSLYRITGGPRWVDSDLYSITAKAPAGSAAARFLPETPNAAPPPEFRAMLQSLLADRFGLKIHRETRELPVLALVIAKGGPKLEPAHDTSAAPRWSMRSGKLEAHNRDIAWLIAVLERHFERTILDRTGLTGSYDLAIEYDPEQRDDADSSRPSFTTALQTQLGLKLEATKGAVEVLVIDEARKPGAN